MQDAAELEQLLRQYVTPPDLLREAHASLRAFRTLLFAPPSDLPVGKDSGTTRTSDASSGMPVATALLHCFSRLPAQVAAPHERLGVSAKQYSQWLDQHSEREVKRSVLDALTAARTGNPEHDALVASMRAVAQA